MADGTQQPNYELIGILVLIVIVSMSFWWANA
jgi:hypothetical protein